MHLFALLMVFGCLHAIASVVPRPRPLAPQPVKRGSYEGYAIVYITNSTASGNNVYLAVSNGNDALNWIELGGGRPVLTPTAGTEGLRDPFILRSHSGSKFYLLASHIPGSSGVSWNSSVPTRRQYLEVWETTDLTTWSAQRHVLLSPTTAGSMWAPKAFYDDSLGQYVVFWASSQYHVDATGHTGILHHRMMYATTSDFVTFSRAQIWQDSGTSRTDSAVLKYDDVYYRFTQDDGDLTGCSDIIQENCSKLTAQLSSWKSVSTCIGKNIGLSAVESPMIFQSNPNDINGDKFYLFVNEHKGRGYIPLETTDIANPNWKISTSFEFPRNLRYGNVLPVTAAELSRITSALSGKGGLRMVKRDSPVLPGYSADPNIAVFGNTYYIYPTTDGYPNWDGQTFYWWKSADLALWTRSSRPFLTLNGIQGNVPWSTGSAWAPTIIRRNGKYYFYFSGQNPTYDRKTIGVAIAESPEGPFTAEPKAMILNNEALTSSVAIDPAAFFDPKTGKYYLYWGNGTPLMAELSDDMLSIKASTLRITTGLTDFCEAAFMIYRKGLYHLTYSIDDTRSRDYRVGYATATSATGPFTYRGVILQKDVSRGILGTGHSSIVNVPGTDNWYIAYHRFAIPNGNGTMRETTIDRLYFNEKTGLIVPVVPTLTSVPPLMGCTLWLIAIWLR
ncbi:glycosyl hydrolase [Xylaria intraflava]|nr:glycosyl hydrolase [Xylaria intraflava]